MKLKSQTIEAWKAAFRTLAKRWSERDAAKTAKYADLFAFIVLLVVLTVCFFTRPLSTMVGFGLGACVYGLTR